MLLLFGHKMSTLTITPGVDEVLVGQDDDVGGAHWHLGPRLGFLKYFRRKKSAKKFAFLTQNKATKLYKNLIITSFLKKRQFIHRKMLKIAEKCDHNTDPRTDYFYTRSEKWWTIIIIFVKKLFLSTSRLPTVITKASKLL
jgi:hypothetical protein